MAETYKFLGHRVEVRRKSFHRGLGVSIAPNGSISVSVGQGCSWLRIENFLQEKKSWVESSLAEVNALKKKYPRREFRSGESYPYLGREYNLLLRVGEKVSLEFLRDKILFTIPVEELHLREEQREKFLKKLRDCYKETAKKIIAQRILLYSEKMRLYPNKVSYRGQRSIWGSCSAQNNLSMNWKLIVAPLPVIDYVVVHELSHIKHKNHSSRFWALVEKTLPNVAPHKKWLNSHHYSADFLVQPSELWG